METGRVWKMKDSAANYREITRNSYDETADAYQANTEKLGPEVKARQFLSFLKGPSKILDLGCGPGRDAKYFVAMGHEVTGIDISPKMIEIAKASVPKAQFLVSDIEGFDPGDGAFDAIWASASLLHVPKKLFAKTLAKIRMSLKPEGIFYVSMKKGSGEELAADARYGGVEKFWNYVQEEELAEKLIGQGFQILEKATHEASTSYQTHPWISVICKKA